MKKNNQGYCAVCGNFGKLSFEHVPPQAAFNNKPIFIQTYEHLSDSNPFLHGKKMTSNKGFGGYTLCELCNKTTGSWYAKDFAIFAQQGMEIINKAEPKHFIKGVYLIKPLNVIKQILTMFMSADKGGHLRSQKSLVNFILKKEETGFPEKYSIFLYSTLSSVKRMMGYSVI